MFSTRILAILQSANNVPKINPAKADAATIFNVTSKPFNIYGIEGVIAEKSRFILFIPLTEK
jgi:hypothetical protein